MAPPIDENSKFVQVKREFHRYNNPNQVLQTTIKDSYRLIPMVVSGFGECFKLEVSKEVMPYEIHTEDNLRKEYVPITEAIEAITKVHRV